MKNHPENTTDAAVKREAATAALGELNGPQANEDIIAAICARPELVAVIESTPDPRGTDFPALTAKVARVRDANGAVRLTHEGAPLRVATWLREVAASDPAIRWKYPA